MNTFRQFGLLQISALLMGFSAAHADIIYDNRVHSLNTTWPVTGEMADEVIFSGSARYLTNFSFEYYSKNGTGSALEGTVQGRVRFYQNDGTSVSGFNSPGTLFWDSGLFSISYQPLGATRVFQAGSDFAGTGLLLPSATNMSFSVEFTGMAGADQVGVVLFGPPASGNGYQDYWVKEGTTWALKGSPSGDVSFGALFEASPVPVPEPSTLAFLSIGAAALLLRRRE